MREAKLDCLSERNRHNVRERRCLESLDVDEGGSSVARRTSTSFIHRFKRPLLAKSSMDRVPLEWARRRPFLDVCVATS